MRPAGAGGRTVAQCSGKSRAEISLHSSKVFTSWALTVLPGRRLSYAPRQAQAPLAQLGHKRGVHRHLLVLQTEPHARLPVQRFVAHAHVAREAEVGG